MTIRSSTKDACDRAWVVFILLLFWLTLPPSPAAAVTYYVDTDHPNARDTNPGTEALPFKTIGKTTSIVNAGDTVFIKAGVYREMVILSRSGTATTLSGRNGTTTITSPITFAAYPGHEGKAIITAAEPVTNWRRCTGPQDCAGNPNWEHTYWADVAALVQSHPDTAFAVRQVFQHGKRLKRSRYPDAGWSYPTSMPNPMLRFSDTTLDQPDGYFAGAVCHIKTALAQIDQIPIADFSRGMITLSKSPRYAITTRYGYYLTSIVGEINEEGEWAYDPAQKRIYLWPQGDAPEGVEFSYRQYCLRSYSGTSWNVVRGLTMRSAYLYNIFLYRSHHMRIEDNTSEDAYGLGIYVYAGAGATGDYNQIVHNTIRRCAYIGLSVDIACSHTNVEGNSVYATGTDTFGGDLMNGRGEALYISGPYTRVFHNRIDRTGHVGIYVSGKTLSRDISYNYATNIALALADTGGLYTPGYSDGPEKDHIHHNIFVDCLGCLSMDRNYDNGQAPTPGTHSGVAHGIYLDAEANHRRMEHNTAIRCSMYGIFFHWAPENVAQNNTLYGNREGQVFFNGHNEDRRRLVNDILLDNILFATASQQDTLYVGMNYDGIRFGQSDRNYFYNPYNNMAIFVNWLNPYTGVRTTEHLSLWGWRVQSGYDGNSKDFAYLEQRNDLALAYPRTSRIVYNTTLDVMTVDLAGNRYCDVEGRKISGAVTLQPFESKILISLDPDSLTPPEPEPEPEP